MKKLLVSFTIMLSPLLCTAAPPTDESIMRLFKTMESESMVDGIYGAMEPMIRRSVDQLAARHTLTDEQKMVLDRMPQRLSAVLRTELSWEKMLPMMIDIYRTGFDQAEIDGLNAFYASPIGQSYIKKMPKVMHETMLVTQKMMEQITPRITAAMVQLLAEAKLPPPTR